MTARLPIAPERIAPTLSLLPGERHYLLDVLRLGDGAEVEVFDGLGGRFPARLDAAAAALVLGARCADREEAPAIALAPALIKNDRLDWVMEKATELGARRIEPLLCANCVVRIEGERAAQRQARWQKIAAAAARQCGRAFIPEVRAPASLAEILERAQTRGELAIALFEREAERTLTQVLQACGPARPLLLISGPEGGFRDEEIEVVRSMGAQTASLGKRILRAETAPIAALAVALALRGEM